MNNHNISRKILKWYDNNKRSLPWRKRASKIKKEYFTLVSEFMLQQTQVKTVIPYFKNFIRVIPDLNSLAKVKDKKLMKCWEGLGYYSRARNLKKTAIAIIKNFNGKLPNTVEDLKSLPGIGNYTSSAIMAIAFNKKIIPMDGNVERVLKRVLFLKKDFEISKENLIKKKSFFGKSHRASDYAQAIMEIGALVCKPLNPECKECPISKECLSYKNNNFEINSILKFNKIKYFEVKIFQNKSKKFYLVKNSKFNFLKNMPIFPMKEISINDYKKCVGKKINLKMSNMNMFLVLKKIDTIYKLKNGFFLEANKFNNLALPSFTKKIFSLVKL